MRILVLTAIIAAAVSGPALSKTAAKPASKFNKPAAAEMAAPVVTPGSTLLEGAKGIQLMSGEKVTLAVDSAGVISIARIEKLGWNAVAPGPGGAASIGSTAAPGTVVYSLQGPILKIESGLAAPFNYSAVATLVVNEQSSTQNVKTCTVLPRRAVFEMWSAKVAVPSVVVGPPVAYSGAPGCA